VSSHRRINERPGAAGSTVRAVCYPDSVLFHVRLRGVTEEQAQIVANAPGFHCRFDDDGPSLVSIRLAHDVPCQPDTDAMEQRVRLALHELVPDAEIVDVRFGLRFAREEVSPALEALHRLRRDIRHMPALDDVDRDDLAETLTVIAREFAHLDEWLCNGGSLPREWARRHPQGDKQTTAQIVASHDPGEVAMAG
jgi:hypothetical protein